MSELRPENRALFAQARRSFEPSPEDRRRVAGSLGFRVGVAAGAAASTTAASKAAAAAAKSGWVVAAKFVAVASLVGGVGAGGVSLYRAHTPVALAPAALASGATDRPAPTAVAVAPPSAAVETSPVSAAGEPSPASAIVPGPATTTRAATAPAAAMSVEVEARILADANAALRAGNAPHALALLDEHAQRFPRGALVEERLAERVLALCQLGRTEAAQKAASSFLAEHSDSPLAGRVRSSCAGVVPPHDSL